MPSPELLEYIKKAKERGVNDDAIRGILKNNGWTDADISEAERYVPQNMLQTAPPPTSRQFLSEEADPPKNPVVSGVDTTLPKPKSKGLKTVIVFFVVLLFLGGAGVFAYFNFEEYFGISAEKRIVQSFLNLQEQSGMRIDGSFALTNEDTDIRVGVNGSFQEKEGNNLKQSGTVSIEVYYNPKNISPDPYSPKPKPVQFSLFADVRLLDQILYVSLNDNTNFGPLDIFGISELKGKWISIPLNNLESLSQKTKIDPKRAGLTKEEVEVIDKKYENMERIVIEEKDTEKINGVDTKYYVFHFNPEMESFFQDILQESLVKQGKTSKEIEESKNAFHESFGTNLLNHQGKIWIGEDYLPYRISFEATIFPPENSYSESKEMTLNLDINFTDFNKDIVVEAPNESMPLNEIMQEMFIVATSSATSTSEL